MFDVHSQDSLPDQFQQKPFYTHCHKHLTADGIFSGNYSIQSISTIEHQLSIIRSSFNKQTLLVPRKDCLNQIIIAFKEKNYHQQLNWLHQEAYLKQLQLDLAWGTVASHFE